MSNSNPGMDEMQLAPRPDFDALKERLGATGRVHIPEIFPGPLAQAIRTALVNETPWTLAVTGLLDMTKMQLEALTLPEREHAARAVEENARAGFYYVFDTYRVKDQVEAKRSVAEAHRNLFLFMNSEPFLDFARRLTGDARINYVDMQATRYRAGHFLNTHSDEKEGSGRLYAYVLNLTPDWRAEWGGLLLFLDENGNVTEGFTPTFNALNILKVPAPHCVSMVTPSAPDARYSFTGWMRAVDAPPKIPNSP